MQQTTVAVVVTPEMKAALLAVKEREGVPISEQVRRAVKADLERRKPKAGAGEQ